MIDANPRKARGVRDLGPVSVAALRERVLAIPEEVWAFGDAAKPNRFAVLGRARHIVFRFVDSVEDWRSSHDGPLWATWREHVEPVLADAVAPYGYARGAHPRIMLARLGPGDEIQPHHDAGPAASWPHKIHVPLCTNPGVEFSVDGQLHEMREGRAYEVDNRALHAAANRGATDRIHLIFEYFDLDQPVPAWRELADRAAARAR